MIDASICANAKMLLSNTKGVAPTKAPVSELYASAEPPDKELIAL